MKLNVLTERTPSVVIYILFGAIAGILVGYVTHLINFGYLEFLITTCVASALSGLVATYIVNKK